MLSPDYLEVPEGSSPSVSFSVSSEPPLADDTKHTITTSEGGRVTRRFKIRNGSITFQNVRSKDSGIYIITCRNDDGEVGSGEIELEVTPKPADATDSGTDQEASAHHTGMFKLIAYIHRVKFTISAVVKEEDISFLMDILCKYASEWKNIGTALNFLPTDLKMIDFSLQATTLQQRLMEILTQWSHRTHPHVPTVEELCAALRSNLVGLGDVANEIEEKKSSLPSQRN